MTDENKGSALPNLQEYLYHSALPEDASGNKLIGVIIPSDINPAFPDMADKIKRAASKYSMHALVCNAGNSVENEKACIRLLVKNVAGFIAMPVSDQSHATYASVDAPVVMLGCRTEESALGYAAMDDKQAGRLAAERLIAGGHRSFAFLAPQTRSVAVTDRLSGVTETIYKHDAEVRVVKVPGGYLRDSYQTMKQLLLNKQPPTAIIAAEDFTAIGAWQALRENKLAVGTAYALIGFGNTPFAALPKHGLSSIGPDANMSMLSLELLQGMQKGFSGLVSRRLLPPVLVCRSTFTTA